MLFVEVPEIGSRNREAKSTNGTADKALGKRHATWLKPWNANET
jgi:hypothetical protein